MRHVHSAISGRKLKTGSNEQLNFSVFDGKRLTAENQWLKLQWRQQLHGPAHVSATSLQKSRGHHWALGWNPKTVSQLALASCSLKEYILCFHHRLNLSSSAEFPTSFQNSLVQRAHSKAESHSTGVFLQEAVLQETQPTKSLHCSCQGWRFLMR